MRSAERDTARAQILDAANKHRRARMRRGLAIGVPYLAPPFLPRHIQQAVCVVRRNLLVKPEVLRAAGYRERER